MCSVNATKQSFTRVIPFSLDQSMTTAISYIFVAVVNRSRPRLVP